MKLPAVSNIWFKARLTLYAASGAVVSAFLANTSLHGRLNLSHQTCRIRQEKCTAHLLTVRDGKAVTVEMHGEG
ncbi:hypothetical protein BDV10DRAFT_176382 [Aspergillus recurvatus]